MKVPGELDRTPLGVPGGARDPEGRHVGAHAEHPGRPGIEQGGLELLPGSRYGEAVTLAHERVQARAEVLPEQPRQQPLRKVVLLQHQRLASPRAHPYDHVYPIILRNAQARSNPRIVQIPRSDGARLEHPRPRDDAAPVELVGETGDRVQGLLDLRPRHENPRTLPALHKPRLARRSTAALAVMREMPCPAASSRSEGTLTPGASSPDLMRAASASPTRL